VDLAQAGGPPLTTGQAEDHEIFGDRAHQGPDVMRDEDHRVTVDHPRGAFHRRKDRGLDGDVEYEVISSQMSQPRMGAAARRWATRCRSRRLSGRGKVIIVGGQGGGPVSSCGWRQRRMAGGLARPKVTRGAPMIG